MKDALPERCKRAHVRKWLGSDSGWPHVDGASLAVLVVITVAGAIG